MNSEQLENKKINTSCKECLFAIYNGNTQTGCKFNRTDKFENIVEAYDNDKEFFVISRLCNYYRDKNWNNGFADKDLVIKQSAITFDILFNLNKISDKFLDNLKAFIDFNTWGDGSCIIESQLYDQNKLDYSAYHEEIPKENRRQIADFYLSCPRMSLTSNKIDDNFFLHERLMKTNKSYHLIIDINSEFDQDVINKVNNVINNDLRMALVMKNKNVYIISNLAYKIHHYKSQDNEVLYNKNIGKIIDYIKTTDLYVEI